MTVYDESFTGSAKLQSGDVVIFTVGGADSLNPMYSSLPSTDQYLLIGGVETTSSDQIYASTRSEGLQRTLAPADDYNAYKVANGGTSIEWSMYMTMSYTLGARYYRNILYSTPGAKVCWKVSGTGNFFAGVSNCKSLSTEMTGASLPGVSLEFKQDATWLKLRLDGKIIYVPFSYEEDAQIVIVYLAVECVTATTLDIRFYHKDEEIAYVADWECYGAWCPTVGAYNTAGVLDRVSLDDGRNGFSYD